MFKFLVIILLCVIAIKSCSADVNIVTAKLPLTNSSYVYIAVNDYRDVFHVPFALPYSHWSY